MRPAPLLAALALALVPTLAARAALGDEDLAVVVHPSSPVEHLDGPALEAVFTSAQRAWPDSRNVVALSYAPDDPRRIQFDRVVLHMEPDQVARFWVDQKVRGGGRPPRQVADPLLALRMVARLPGAIAYLPAGLVDDTVKVVARLKGGRVADQGPPPKRGAR